MNFGKVLKDLVQDLASAFPSALVTIGFPRLDYGRDKPVEADRPHIALREYDRDADQDWRLVEQGEAVAGGRTDLYNVNRFTARLELEVCCYDSTEFYGDPVEEPARASLDSLLEAWITTLCYGDGSGLSYGEDGSFTFRRLSGRMLAPVNLTDYFRFLYRLEVTGNYTLTVDTDLASAFELDVEAD